MIKIGFWPRWKYYIATIGIYFFSEWRFEIVNKHAGGNYSYFNKLLIHESQNK